MQGMDLRQHLLVRSKPSAKYVTLCGHLFDTKAKSPISPMTALWPLSSLLVRHHWIWRFISALDNSVTQRDGTSPRKGTSGAAVRHCSLFYSVIRRTCLPSVCCISVRAVNNRGAFLAKTNCALLVPNGDHPPEHFPGISFRPLASKGNAALHTMYSVITT